MSKPVSVTLFSGVAGSSKALRDLGYAVHAHDFMPEAIQSLRSNGFHAYEYDVQDTDWKAAYRGADVKVLEERLILQDFPADWIVCGKEASRDLQVGNSVPVGMMRRVIEANL